MPVIRPGQSKLALVDATLKDRVDRGDIVVIGPKFKTFSSVPPHMWSEIAEFHVAPRISTYNAGELQILMFSLVPEGLVPDSHPRGAVPFPGADFRFSQIDKQRGKLEFGFLHFDERVGSVTITTSVTMEDEDPQFLLRAMTAQDKDGVSFYKVVVNERGEGGIMESQELGRRTRVRVYPDVKRAKSETRSMDLSGKQLAKAIARE